MTYGWQSVIHAWRAFLWSVTNFSCYSRFNSYHQPRKPLLAFVTMSPGSCSGARACLCGQRLGFKRAPSKQRAIWSSGFYCAPLFSLRSHQIEILSTAFSASIPLTFFWVVHVYVTEWHNVKMWLQCFRTQACSRQPCTKCRFSALTSVNRTLLPQ